MKIWALMILILLSYQFSAVALSVQISPAKRVSVSGGHFSHQIGWSRRAPKTTGCLAPDLETIEINNNVLHVKNSQRPKLFKMLIRKFFFKKSQKETLNQGGGSGTDFKN